METDMLLYSVDEVMSFLRGLKATPGWRKRLFSDDYNTRVQQTENLFSRVETLVGDFESHHYSLLVYMLNGKLGHTDGRKKFQDLVHLMVTQATRRYKNNRMTIAEMLSIAHEVRQAEVYSSELSRFMLDVLNDMLISVEDRHLVLLQNQFKHSASYPSEVIEMLCMRLLTSSPGAITGRHLAVLCMSMHDWDGVGQKVLMGLGPMVIDKAPRLVGQDAANLLYAYGRQGVFHEEIYRVLCDRLCLVMDDLEIRHMQQISDTFQYFNYRHEEVLENMARHTGTIVEDNPPLDYPEQIVQLFRYAVNCGCYDRRAELALPIVRYMEEAVGSATITDLSHFTVSYGQLLRSDARRQAHSSELMQRIGDAILALDKIALDPRDCANLVYGLGMLAPSTTETINRVNQAARDFVHVFEDPAFVRELKTVPMSKFMAGFGAINFPFRITSLNNCGDVILDNAIQVFTQHHLYGIASENLVLFLGGLADYGYIGYLDRLAVLERIRNLHTQQRDMHHNSNNNIINQLSHTQNHDMHYLSPSGAVSLLSAVCRLRLLDRQESATIQSDETKRSAVRVLIAAVSSGGGTELSLSEVAAYAEAVGMLAINHPENQSHLTALKSAWEGVIMPRLRAYVHELKDSDALVRGEDRYTDGHLSSIERRQLWDGYLALKHLYPDTVKRFQTDDADVVKDIKFTRTDEEVFQQGLGWNAASRGTTNEILNKFLVYIGKELRSEGYGVEETYTPSVHEATGYTLNATLLVDPSSVPAKKSTAHKTKHSRKGSKPAKPVLVYILMQPDSAYLQANEVVTLGRRGARLIGGVGGGQSGSEVNTRVVPNGAVIMRDRLLGYHGVCVLGLNMRDMNEFTDTRQRIEFATKLIKAVVDGGVSG